MEGTFSEITLNYYFYQISVDAAAAEPGPGPAAMADLMAAMEVMVMADPMEDMEAMAMESKPQTELKPLFSNQHSCFN